MFFDLWNGIETVVTNNEMVVTNNEALNNGDKRHSLLFPI